MTGTGFLLLSLAVVAAFVDWTAVQQDRRTLEYLCKPLTMVGLIAAAVALDPSDEAVRWYFVVALTLSLVGDVFLMLPTDRFVQGLGAFLLAHVAYILGMHVAGVEVVAFLFGVIVAMAVLVVVGRRVLAAVQATEPPLAAPVVTYMAVIAAMLASAIGTGNVAAGLGAVSFVSSDGLIAWNRFVEPKPWAPVAIIVSYHLGQLLLVLSLI